MGENIMQNDYINDYNREHYKQITIRVSPEEAEEIKATATKARKSIKLLIISAVRLYAENITQSNAQTADKPPINAERQEDKPEEDKPQDTHNKPQEPSKEPSKASPETSPEDFTQAIREAYKEAYKQARQEIKAIEETRQKLKGVSKFVKRPHRTVQARRRTKVYK